MYNIYSNTTSLIFYEDERYIKAQVVYRIDYGEKLVSRIQGLRALV